MLVGHYSEARARKDAERIANRTRRRREPATD
ncbi:DUF3560 domain-containing protein [Cupriavidus sp. USMAHM13]